MSQKEFFLKLANEVIKRCSGENIVVPIDLSVHLIKLKLLRWSKDFSCITNDETLAETIVKDCVAYFRVSTPAVETLKLQLFWQKRYHSLDEIKKTHHERILKNILPIMSEIVEHRTVKAADKDLLSKKIVIFIMMFAGLGSPTQHSLIKETNAALLSIFKATELENFLSLPSSIKKQQLIELSRLITGILLFNKDCKKGGEEMDDLPLILTEGVRATKDRLLGFKDQVDQKIDQLVKTILHSFNTDLQENTINNESDERFSKPTKAQKEKLEEFKTILVYYRHIESYLNDLIKDLEKSFTSVEELVEQLQTTLLQVHNVVRYRVAVATLQVFPLFLQLSDIWVKMQEEVDILSEINDNFVDLSLAVKLQLFLPPPVELLTISDDDSYLKSLDTFDFSDAHPEIKVCSISSLQSHENLQYKGFCAWTLANSEGMLITGNITLGVIHFSNRFYTFSSCEAARKWALNPTYYIETVLKIAAVKYELITFLNLETDLIEKLSTTEDQKPTKGNVQTQTDLHPLGNFINKNYTFSEWEIKRRIMKIATLNRYVTKSQQTAKQSCFRKDTAVQVSPSKTVSTQTAKDAFCNHYSLGRYAWVLKMEPHNFLFSD